MGRLERRQRQEIATGRVIRRCGRDIAVETRTGGRRRLCNLRLVAWRLARGDRGLGVQALVGKKGEDGIEEKARITRTAEGVFHTRRG